MFLLSDRAAALGLRRLRGLFSCLFVASTLAVAAPAFAAVDLVVNNTDTGYDPTPAGGVVQYTVRIDNNGNSGATGVTLSDSLPANTAFVSSSATQGSCAAPAGGVLSCALGDLGSLASTTVLVRVRALSAGLITNTASATANEPDTDHSNDTNIQQQTTISQGADLQLSVSASAASVASGSSLSYSFAVRNGGPDTASSVQLVANLPPGFVVSGGLPAGCSLSGQTLTCTLSGSIAVGAVWSIGPINGTVTAAGGSTLTVSSSASVTSSSAAQDPDTTNNTATASTAVTAGSDVALTLSASTASPVLVGSQFNFVLGSTYSGDNPQNLTLTSTLPGNYQILNPASFSSNGWSCNVSGQTVSCTRPQGGSAAGSNVAIGSVTVQVRAVTAGNGVTTSASIGSSTPDANSANNSAQLTLNIVNPTADLSGSKSGPNPALATVGSSWTWTLSMRNNGPAALTGTAIMTDTLPVGVTLQAYTATNGWSCSPAAPFTASGGNQTLTCSREYTAANPLASGAWAPQVSYTASATAAGNYANTVCASAAASANGTPPPDGNSANDCATHTMQVQTAPGSANLSLSKLASPATVPAGDVLTYTLQIVNAGPNAATNVTLSDTLDNLINSNAGPTGAGFVAASIAAGSSTGGACTSTASGSNTRALSCTFASIPACTAGGDCPVVTVQVRLGGDGGARTNSASASSADVADPDYSNNSASVTSQVDPRADVTVTATATPNPVAAGQNLTYVLTVRNAGPSTAQAVQLGNALPLDVTFLGATASGGGSCSALPAANATTTASNQNLSCGWSSIGNGAQQTLTVVVRPNTATRSTTLVDNANVSTSTTETNTANNTGSVSVQVSNPALDLLANVVDNPDPVAVGDTMQYTYTVTNRGPSYAENATIAATLPAALLSYQSLSAPAGVSCTTPAVGSYGGNLSCTMGGLAVGASASINVTLLATAKGTTTTTLTVASDETRAGFDSLPANNTATEQTTVRNKADVAVTSKTASPAAVGLREVFHYTIAIRNNGPGAADAVQVSDNLPSGMVLTGTPGVVPGNAADFPGLPAAPCSGSAGATAFTCALGDAVAAGATATLTVPVMVVTAPGANPGTLTNTASIATSSKDEQPTNNSASGAVTVQTASLTGRVYADRNDNGTQDAGEAGIGGVSVSLGGTAPDGSAVSRTATTAADGSYQFTGLPAGTYTVSEQQPAGWVDGRDAAGSAGGTVSPPDSISGIVLARNTAATDYLFGELPLASLSGVVYRDLNNDGVPQSGEAGIVAVTLTLSGTDAQGQTVNRTTTTAANGSYSFTDLAPGNYNIVETQPSGLLPGKATPGQGVSTAGSAAVDGNAISGIVLAAGQTGTAFNFGELPPTSLAGAVYVDANRNGVRDASETTGIDGVTITLSGSDDRGQAVSQSVVTAQGGQYQFNNLRPGTYALTETQPAQWTDGGDSAGTVGGSPRGTAGNDVINGITLNAGDAGVNYNFGEIGQGLSGSVYDDLNGNGQRDAGEPGIPGVTITATNAATGAVFTQSTDASGNYLFVDLPAATYTLHETQPGGYADGAEQLGSLGGTASANDTMSGIVLGTGQFGTSYNFGEIGAQLSGAVYFDANGNGRRDAGETGIPGVNITLSGTDNQGAAVQRSVTTDASGNFAFTHLLPSSAAGYTLTETQPAAYADGAEQPGNLGGTAGAPGSSVISGIVLTAGAGGTGYLFGEVAGGISGVVYQDLNNNGLRDAGETGIGGVAVQLQGNEVGGQAVNRNVTTAADGSYSFTGLLASDSAGYTLIETQPATYLDGKTTAGLVNGTPCAGCNVATPNRIAGIVFDPAHSYTAFNFGELPAASLSGVSFDDLNGNGVADPGEGLPGVTITLTGTDDRGVAVTRTVVTGADGGYSITGLRPGSYTVTQTQPAGFADVATRAGSAGGQVSTNQIAAVVLAPGAAATGYDFLERGAALSGVVYLDSNGNGARDAGEPGIAGVVLTLGGDATRTTTTAADGSYSFLGLAAGSYSVTETQPVLYKDGKAQPGSLGGTAQTNAITGITLSAGSQASAYDFSELPGAPGAIAGTVWLNKSGGSPNAQDAGEPGLQGWTITLLRNGKPVPGVAPAQTDAQGHYLLRDVPAGSGYTLQFTTPGGAYYGYPVSQDPNPQWNGQVDRTAAIPAIVGITVGSGVTVTQQSLPIDPSGVVYDSATRAPVSGAVVTLLGPNGQPVDAALLVGGSANVSQTTGPDGFYQFLLLPSAPAGTYTLQVQPPPGYLPPPSSVHPPTAAVLNPPAGAGIYAVSNVSGPPPSGPLPPYYLAINLGPSTDGVVGNHIPLDPVQAGALSVRKTTPKVNVLKAELVPYTITVTNTLDSALPGMAVRDRVPPGFKYRAGSARVDGVATEPQINGRDLTWPNLQFAPHQSRTVQLVLVVGVGVGESEYVNQAWALNGATGGMASNIGTAAVRVVPDATFDCSDLIGKVFDDRNANGVQDAGEPGLPGIRLVTVRGQIITTDAQGRYHVPCAATPALTRGENFVLKLDTRSLPTGYRLTTENPGDVRLTAGKMAKLNFGATIHRVVRLDLSSAAFAPGADTLLPAEQPRLKQLFGLLRERPSVLRLAYHLQAGEPSALAKDRLDALRERIAKDWTDGCGCAPLPVETEIIEGERQ